MGVKHGHTTKGSETEYWHLRCTVTASSYASVGQSEKQTAKFVTNMELKKSCYTADEVSTAWPHVQDGEQQKVKKHWCSES